jgi:hypothetical protein
MGDPTFPATSLNSFTSMNTPANTDAAERPVEGAGAFTAAIAGLGTK